jgi:hypothetical protein
MSSPLRFALFALVVLAGVVAWMHLCHIGRPVPWWGALLFNLACVGLLLWALERSNGPDRTDAGKGAP